MESPGALWYHDVIVGTMTNKECRCGCGGFVTKESNSFIRGHNARTGAKELTEARRKSMTQEKRAQQADIMRAVVKKAKDEGKYSAHVKKLWNENRDVMVEAKMKGARTFSERVRSGEITVNRDKISESISERYLQGGFQWARGHYGKPGSKSTKASSYYRSSWELAYMRQLDSDQSVKSWTHEPFWIRYEWKGKRRYIPDFIVRYADGRVELVELGVKALKDLDRNVAKSEAGKRLCDDRGWVYRIVTDILSSPDQSTY